MFYFFVYLFFQVKAYLAFTRFGIFSISSGEENFIFVFMFPNLSFRQIPAKQTTGTLNAFIADLFPHSLLRIPYSHSRSVNPVTYRLILLKKKVKS